VALFIPESAGSSTRASPDSRIAQFLKRPAFASGFGRVSAVQSLAIPHKAQGYA
jgi:hypothetical protein